MTEQTYLHNCTAQTTSGKNSDDPKCTNHWCQWGSIGFSLDQSTKETEPGCGIYSRVCQVLAFSNAFFIRYLKFRENIN